MSMKSLQRTALGFVVAAAVTSGTAFAQEAPASAQVKNPDPWEGFNRAMFQFNDTLDTYALKPVAKGYRYVMPDIAEKGVSNFFDNLSDVGSFFNNLLQFKIDNAIEDISRVAFNTTFGLAGFIDVATPMGIEKHDEDFGQTLGYWGVSSGPYVVLPFFGPSTVRDGLAMVPDAYTDPLMYVDDSRTRNQLLAVKIVDKRARLLKSEGIISGDRYSFIRDSYLQQREYKVKDGQVDVKYDESNF